MPLKFEPVDLGQLADHGVLMAANEAFFWPLGMALTWEVPTHPIDQERWCRWEKKHPRHQMPDGDEGEWCEGTRLGTGVRNLHVRQWDIDPQETIGLDPKDEAAIAKREAFLLWVEDRLDKIIPDERAKSRALLESTLDQIKGNLAIARRAQE